MTPTGPIKPKHGPQVPQNRWHELVVSPVQNTSTSTTLTEDKEEFHLTVSKSPTPHSLYLPQTSSRYKALSTTENAIIEISPESLSYISDFAIRIGGANPAPLSAPPSKSYSNTSKVSRSTPLEPPFQKATASGAALILDYGPAGTIPANTLRGIRAHKPVSPFTAPGLVDISADVDFIALAETALSSSPGVEVHGPVEQAFFLSTMGIKERAERLVRKAKHGGIGADVDETIKRLDVGWKRLVDRGPTGMGRIYKAMAIVPYQHGKGTTRRPVGFGGDVVG
jgi:NADH dehydrogenase [ubiquinone] 1 alpha subcomplex assembly factor 7